MLIEKTPLLTLVSPLIQPNLSLPTILSLFRLQHLKLNTNMTNVLTWEYSGGTLT